MSSLAEKKDSVAEGDYAAALLACHSDQQPVGYDSVERCGTGEKKAQQNLDAQNAADYLLSLSSTDSIASFSSMSSGVWAPSSAKEGEQDLHGFSLEDCTFQSPRPQSPAYPWTINKAFPQRADDLLADIGRSTPVKLELNDETNIEPFPLTASPFRDFPSTTLSEEVAAAPSRPAEDEAPSNEISLGKGPNVYHTSANKAFIYHLERYKQTYQDIPQGKGERIVKKAFQRKLLNEIYKVLGLHFAGSTSLTHNTSKDNNANDAAGAKKRDQKILERNLEKIRAALCRKESSKIAFPGRRHICLGVEGDALKCHPPNIFFSNWLQCQKKTFAQSLKTNNVNTNRNAAIAREAAVSREILCKLKEELGYCFVRKVDPTNALSLWEEMDDDDAQKYVWQELRRIASTETAPREGY